MESNFSESQKKFLKTLCLYKKDQIIFSFEDFFEEYIKKEYKEIGIQIKQKKLYISQKTTTVDTDLLNKYIDEVVSLLYLIFQLEERKNIFFYEKGNPDVIIIDYLEDYFIIDIELFFLESVIELLQAKYLLTPSLLELVNRNFLTLEQENIRITRKTLYWNIVAIIITLLVTIYGIFLDEKNLKQNTIIEFANPEQLKEISTTTIYLK